MYKVNQNIIDKGNEAQTYKILSLRNVVSALCQGASTFFSSTSTTVVLLFASQHWHNIYTRMSKIHLKDIDDGALHVCILFIWTLSIVQLFNKITVMESSSV
jgi:hypothetical protein